VPVLEKFGHTFPSLRPLLRVALLLSALVDSLQVLTEPRPSCAFETRRFLSAPGSSRRAGGYSPVLRLTADEMSLPLFPCPKKFTFWDTTLTAEGDILGQDSAPARSRTPQGRFPPARLLHPGGRCGTGEGRAGVCTCHSQLR